MLMEEQIPDDTEHIITTSFQNNKNLKHLGKDAFYRCIVDAYANHLSVTLSPDMVWLVISQGLAIPLNSQSLRTSGSQRTYYSMSLEVRLNRRNYLI